MLRSHLPGMAGVRWMRTAGLPPTARATVLTEEQWSKDHPSPTPREPGAGR